MAAASGAKNPKNKPEFKNCLYRETGSAIPTGCGSCGFDKAEAERRKKLPLERGPDGKYRKVIRR